MNSNIPDSRRSVLEVGGTCKLFISCIITKVLEKWSMYFIRTLVPGHFGIQPYDTLCAVFDMSKFDCKQGCFACW